MIELLGSSVFVAALVFGFRHGFDWDHLAALSDLTGSQRSSRRAMRLATLYVAGHACMVLLLGGVAILFAERVPATLDVAMERLVGVSLVTLGAWIAWTAVRTRAAPPLRSRWMLLIGALQRLARRRHRPRELVVIEHSHPHDHHRTHEHSHVPAELLAGGPTDLAPAPVRTVVGTHTHTHRHVAMAPIDPFVAYGDRSSFGVGLLHGIGAETPTQLLVFAAAANAGGRGASLAILICFVTGLVAANTLVAAATTLGFAGVLRHRVVAAGLAAVTAAFSLTLGTLLLTGRSGVLPELFAG